MDNAIASKPNAIKNFIPSWFASVMGTGILALTSLFYSQYFSFLKYISKFLTYFNTGLFFVLLIPWILRWILYKKEAISDLKNPIIGNFYPTIAVALLILSANYLFIFKNILLAKIFWFIGVIVTIYFALLIPYLTFANERVELHHINPGWFIPPVALIVIPIPGGALIPHFTGLLKEIVIFINYFSFGSGFFLYLALFAITFYRFILHKPLPDVLAPTVWINLGPIGAGTSALISITKSCTLLTSKSSLFFFSSILWGFGIWWVLMSIILTLHYIKNVKFPYTMSWWALTFPLGAYTAATHNVYLIFGNKFIDYIGLLLFFLLIFFWTITFIKTFKRVLNGTLFIK